MSEPLVFSMGNYEAEFPIDRMYAKNHMWGQTQADGTIRFGFTAYAVRLLQDVYFLDWSIEAPASIAARAEIGQIESKKAESSLYAPVGGKLTQFNAELLRDPSAINVDKYGKGWLFDIEASVDSLLTPSQYIEHLTAVWEVTQRTIKGQMNE